MHHEAPVNHLENLFHGKKLGRSCYVIRKKNIRIWRPHGSGFISDSKYPLWKAYSKSSRFASVFAGYVWTEGVSGKNAGRHLTFFFFLSLNCKSMNSIYNMNGFNFSQLKIRRIFQFNRHLKSNLP